MAYRQLGVEWNIQRGALEQLEDATYLMYLQSQASSVKWALYRIQILCRRYTFWSYPAELTIADPPG